MTEEERYEWREEMRQDAYEERIQIDKERLLHKEPESIANWQEYQDFVQALEDFKSFCKKHDLDYAEEMEQI